MGIAPIKKKQQWQLLMHCISALRGAILSGVISPNDAPIKLSTGQAKDGSVLLTVLFYFYFIWYLVCCHRPWSVHALRLVWGWLAGATVWAGIPVITSSSPTKEMLPSLLPPGRADYLGWFLLMWRSRDWAVVWDGGLETLIPIWWWKETYFDLFSTVDTIS